MWKWFLDHWKLGIGLLLGVIVVGWRLYGNIQRSIVAERESAERKARLKERTRVDEAKIESNQEKVTVLARKAERARRDREAHEEKARSAGARADAARKQLEQIDAKKKAGSPTARDLMDAVRGLGYR